MKRVWREIMLCCARNRLEAFPEAVHASAGQTRQERDLDTPLWVGILRARERASSHGELRKMRV
jgi:hypothetical protein